MHHAAPTEYLFVPETTPPPSITSKSGRDNGIQHSRKSRSEANRGCCRHRLSRFLRPDVYARFRFDRRPCILVHSVSTRTFEPYDGGLCLNASYLTAGRLGRTYNVNTWHYGVWCRVTARGQYEHDQCRDRV